MELSPRMIGIIIGGVLPAVIFGIGSLFSKASTNVGINIGWYIVCTGIAVMLVGVVFLLIHPGSPPSVRAGLYAAGLGVCWGIGTGLVAIGLSKYRLPISTLTPLFNANTIVTVLLALLIFSEWKGISVWKLLVGVVMTVAGGIIVAGA